ncbi:cytochrome C oxidase subunit IV family protein [Ensifer sp. LCM 4579]|uniref:cytochrome C oxidase subunit IV family protein n=1 Tax=Ensifer sp. LCM 4579 TaxID=1848292 RepID=UPI00155F1914|nr:cytochrome C oxidase subunit IV family protein [Ensifer sp. LCM 4579]
MTVIRLVFVWFALMGLLVTTVGASFFLRGPASMAASTGIAFIKAALIYWFFMHLSEERGLPRLMAVGAVTWLAILIGLSFTDYATRGFGW